MRNRKGEYRWDVAMAMILGLIVFGIIGYLIFGESFNQDQINYEVCRQSIVARSLLPEISVVDITIASFKDKYPLKCKTEVVEVDLVKEDEKIIGAEKKIAEAMVSCWNLYLRGDKNIFPRPTIGATSYCVPCARIHLTEELKDYMIKNKLTIDIEKSLNQEFQGGASAYDFLQKSGVKFSAFGWSGARDFDFKAEKFSLVDDDQDGVIYNRQNGEKSIAYDFGKLYLPKFFYPDKGDLLIFYGSDTFSDSNDIGDYFPYMFYFQSGQTSPDPFKILGDIEFIERDLNILGYQTYGNTRDTVLCENYDGIPA